MFDHGIHALQSCCHVLTNRNLDAFEHDETMMIEKAEQRS